jgi:hypothetical protein
MAKKKTITKESVKAQDEIAPDVVEDTQDEIAPDVVEDTQDEAAAVKTVAKKKGLSSFGSMLAAQNAKRKERKKLYGKEN